MKLDEMIKFATENYRFRIDPHILYESDTEIQLCNIIKPGQLKFFQHCLYIGTVSEFPEKIEIIEDTDNRNIVSFLLIEDTDFKLDINFCDLLNVYVVSGSESINALYETFTEMIQDDNRLAEIMNKLFYELYRNRGLQGIVTAAADIFENSVMVNDVAYNVIAKSSRTPLGDKILSNATGDGFIADSVISEMRNQNIFAELHQSNKLIFSFQYSTNTHWLFKAVRINHTSIADIAIVDDNRPFRYIDFKLIDLLSKMISLEMQKDEYFTRNKNNNYSYFIQDLIEGRLNNKETILHRAAMLGIHFYGNYWISVAYPEDTEQSSDELNYLASQLQQILPEGKWVVYKKAMIGLFSRQNKKKLTEYEYDKLHHFAQENKISIGISDVFYNTTKFPVYYEQALHAAQTPIPGNSNMHIRYYSDIMVYHLIELLAANHSTYEFLHPELIRLEEYDKENNTDLMHTLKQYVLNARNTNKTSDDLSIHRNSLLYRLNRIREITNLDLDDGNEFCKIMLHIRLREYEKGSAI